jgi:hypothetical protein
MRTETRRQIRAVLTADENGHDVIEIRRSDITKVFDGAERRRWSHGDDGESNRVTLETLTIEEAAELLKTLAVCVGWVAAAKAEDA